MLTASKLFNKIGDCFLAEPVPRDLSPIDWWQSTLFDQSVSQCRLEIREMIAAQHQFKAFLAGYSSMLSSSTEVERAFRAVGRQWQDRESIGTEQLLAELRVIDYLKSNAGDDAAEFNRLIDTLAAAIDKRRQQKVQANALAHKANLQRTLMEAEAARQLAMETAQSIERELRTL